MITPDLLVAPEAPKGFMAWLEQPHVKWAVPLPLLLALAPLIWLFFRSTWKELDREAVTYRERLREAGSEVDYRPLIALGSARSSSRSRNTTAAPTRRSTRRSSSRTCASTRRATPAGS
ncbi:MAG: hypothetical protein IPJ34_30465 [Myxococcales bacterium]|nr:hypothetical protein [Myxococcales bacterium]